MVEQATECVTGLVYGLFGTLDRVGARVDFRVLSSSPVEAHTVTTRFLADLWRVGEATAKKPEP